MAKASEDGPDQLDRLLSQVGPGVAGQLLAQLVQDLGGVARGLAAALPLADRDAVRRQTHILTGLAGTLGAHALLADALALNAAAHDPARPLPADLGPRLTAGLDRLIAGITDRQTGTGG